MKRDKTGNQLHVDYKNSSDIMLEHNVVEDMQYKRIRSRFG